MKADESEATQNSHSIALIALPRSDIAKSFFEPPEVSTVSIRIPEFWTNDSEFRFLSYRRFISQRQNNNPEWKVQPYGSGASSSNLITYRGYSTSLTRASYLRQAQGGIDEKDVHIRAKKVPRAPNIRRFWGPEVR